MNRRLLLVAALLLVVVLGGWYGLAWKPGQARIASAHASDATALTKRAQLDSELGGLHRLQRDLPADQTTLAKALPALPVAASVPSVIDQIAQAARTTGVAWSNESQSTGTSASTSGSSAAAGSVTTGGSGVSTLALTLQVTGSYKAVTSFVTLLTHRPRLIVVDTLSFAPSTSSVAITIGARAFFDPTPAPDVAKLASQP